MSRDEILENGYDLCERVYLSGYEYPKGVPLSHLGDLFNIRKGNAGAAQAEDGPFQFITSSEEPKLHSRYSFSGEAICIPLVSSTGHGHASMKTLHYVKGKFEAATITAVLTPKRGVDVHVPFVYSYLLAHKDELLVPLMRGAANVSLSVDRLGRLRIPLPRTVKKQKALVAKFARTKLEVARCRSKLKATKDKLEAQLTRFREAF